MKGTYICSYCGRMVVVDEAADRDEAARIFVEYLKKYLEIVVRTKEVSVKRITMITRKRGFVEIV